MRGARFRRTCGQASGHLVDQAVLLTRSGARTTSTGRGEGGHAYVASHDGPCAQFRDPVKPSVAGRLIVLIGIGAAFSVFAFVRAWNAGGEPQVVYSILGVMALIGVLLIIHAWIRWTRQSNRR